MLTIKDGKIIKVKGRIPLPLKQDFSTVLRHVQCGKIIFKSSSSGKILIFSGDIDHFTEQKLRNIHGLHYEQ